MQDAKHPLQSQEAIEQQPRAPSDSKANKVIHGLFEIYEIVSGRRISLLRTDDNDRVEFQYNQLRANGKYELHLVLPSKMNEA